MIYEWRLAYGWNLFTCVGAADTGRHYPSDGRLSHCTLRYLAFHVRRTRGDWPRGYYQRMRYW